MTRLRNDPGSTNPVTAAHCARLLASAAPLDPDGAMQDRVHAAILRRAPHRWRVRALPLRIKLALAGVLAMLSTAGAMIGHAISERAAANKPNSIKAMPSRHSRTTAPQSLAPAPIAPTSSVTDIVPLVHDPVRRPTVTHHARPEHSVTAAAVKRSTMANPRTPLGAIAPGARPAPSPTIVPTPEESQLVLAGLRALRIDHESAQASQLFDEYLRRYAGGALVEETLAYAIEAATLRNDPRGAALARHYLRTFPHGRFHDLALRASPGIGRK